MIPVRRLIPILCLSVATTAAVAQTAPSTQRRTEAVIADTDKDVNDPRAMKLSLADAISTSMRQNLGIELQRYEYRMADQGVTSAYGVFDPLASAQLNKGRNEGAATNAFEASSSGATNANVSVRQTIPTGGTYEVGFNNNRFTRGGAGTTLSPGYKTGLTFGFSQPLARDFGVDITRRGILIARNTLGINREAFRGALLDTTNAVEQAYYDLVYARQFIDVVREAVFLARDQARITQIRIDVGASAPLDILQPRVQIATTEEQLISGVANVRSAEDRLRQLMNLPPAEWDRPIVPTDTVQYIPVPVDVPQSVERAYTLRPEVRQNQLTTETRKVQYKYARNQVLPAVDAFTNYNLSGAAGRAIDPQTGVVVNDTRYSNSLSQIFGLDFPGWSIGLNLGVPVFNFTARAEAKRAELDLQQSQLSEEQTRQNIAVDVRTTARAIDTNARQIAASRAAREAAEQNLDAERKRYENGMTTNFQVLQVQQQLSDARARELQALVLYNKAVTAYHRSVGDLLEYRNITVDEPAAAPEPGIFSRFNRYNWLNFSAHDTEPK